MTPSRLHTALSTLALLALLPLGQSLTAADEVPLETELPKPLFVGTPKPIKVPNLEPLRQGKRPDFMVPAGTTNLAAGKEVTGSDEWPVIGELEYLTDGDKEGTDGYFVELGPELQYVQIDLEKEAAISAVIVWHYHASPRVYHDVVVQVADDPEFKSGVRTIFNNDNDNSAGLGVGSDRPYIESYDGRLIDAKGVRGRYVRLYSNGSTADGMNHYIEVEVFGIPVG
ncbi:MAG: hypothetical protein R3F07_13630 [Opitutaceae bacterium]